jgi:hypothetical protein
MVQWLEFLSRIWEVPGSNLNTNSKYVEGFVGFLSPSWKIRLRYTSIAYIHMQYFAAYL